MLIEQRRKHGCFCEEAKAGRIRCPLNLRSTSEDVVTDQLFGVLQALNPRWWLPDLINHAMESDCVRRQIFRQFKIDLWQKQTQFPRELLPWDEGRTEVDTILSWSNFPTTVFVEMKYGSQLSSATTHNNGHAGYPSDQLIRNIRLGLWKCGWFREDTLFEIPRRDFFMVLISPKSGNPLVSDYRDPKLLLDRIPNGNHIAELPPHPFVGELNYGDLATLLLRNLRWFTRPERILVEQLADYLEYKRHSLKTNN